MVAALWLVGRYLKWISTNFVITSQRLIFRQGIIAKSGIEIPLDRVNNVNFSQGIIERMLGAGDLLIESGGEDGQQRFTDIRHPDEVQNLIHAQVEHAVRRRAGYSAGSAAPGGRWLRPRATRAAGGPAPARQHHARGVRGAEAQAVGLNRTAVVVSVRGQGRPACGTSTSSDLDLSGALHARHGGE